MSRRGPKWDRLSVVLVGGLLAGGLVTAAIREDGFRSDHVTLDDNAVWVLKQDQTIGRFNYDLQMVDTNSTTLDPVRAVHQIDSTVIIETASSKVFSYNVAMNRADGEGTVLPPNSSLSIGGEHGALLDAKDGKVWFTDRTGIASIVFEGEKETPGSVTLKGADKLLVGTDGALHVIDSLDSRIWQIDEPFSLASPASPGAPGPESTIDSIVADAQTTSSTEPVLPADEVGGVALDVDLSDGDYQMTTAGDRLVLLRDRTIVLEDGTEIALPSEVGDQPLLQQPSSDSSQVLIASDKGLAMLSLAGGAATVVAAVDASDPIQPVWLANCAYGAWPDTVVSTCSKNPVVSGTFPSGSEFRTNRNRAVLNFSDGSLIAFPDGEEMVRVDNAWSNALDPSDQTDDLKTSEAQQPDQTENKCEIPVTNSPPIVPLSTTFTVRLGQSTTLDVLNPPGTDSPASDPDCDVLTVAVDADAPLDPTSGTLAVVNAGRALQFQPNGDAGSAPVTISYIVSDGSADGSVRASAQVNVIGIDDEGRAPTANRDAITVEVGKTAVVDVLANDVDPDGDALSVKAAVAPLPGDGTLVWQPSGRFAYTAPGSAAGTKTIEYTVTDDHGLQTNGELEISVISLGVITPPNPRSDSVLGMLNTADGAHEFSVNVLANDSDPNGDALRVTEVAAYPPSESALKASVDDDGNVAITPTAAGSYNFEYTVVDVQGQEARSRVRFEILGDLGRQPPVAVRDSVVVSSVRPTVVDVLRNDTDLNGDVLMVTDVVASDSTMQDLNVEVIDNRFVRISTRRSQPSQSGYQFTYTVSDGEQSASTTVAVGIIPSGNTQPPVTLEDRGQVHLGGYLSVPVLLNDFDPNGIPLTVTDAVLDDKVATQGAPGTVFVQGNQVRYLPPTQTARPGPFTATGTYTVNNGRDRQNGRFTIQITDPAQNRPPSPDPVELRTFADEPVTFLVPSFGLDPDGDPVELIGLDGAPPLKGTVESGDTGASFTYTPLPGTTGADAFRWQLRDSFDAIGYLDVRVVIGPRAIGNHPPVAVPDTAQVVVGQSVFIPVLANDTDPDPGDVVTFVEDRPYDQPNDGAGEVTGITDDGFVSFQAPAVEGEYSFLYYITDTNGDSADGLHAPVQGLVTVTVTTEDKIINRPPVVKDIVLRPAKEGEKVTVDLADYSSDPEGQPLAFGPGADAVPLGATVSGSLLSVTMGREPMILTFVADDGAPADAVSIGVIQIPVPKNQAPKAEVIQVEVAAGETTKRIDISSDSFSDPDGDAVQIYRESDPTISPPEASNGGDLKWDGDGFVFNRNPDFAGSAKITYRIVDAPPDSAGEPIVQPASVVLTIKKDVNQRPVVTEDQIDVISGSKSSYDLRSLVSDADPGDETNLTISDVKWSGPSSVAMAVVGTRVTFTASIEAAKVGQTVPAEVTFTADDGRENGKVSGRLVVTVKPTDLGQPVAVDDFQNPVKQGESPTWNLLGNDPPNGTGQGSEPDYEIISTTQPALGTVAVVGRDSVKFTPAPDASGQTSFQYTIEDRAGRQATATVRFSVLAKPAVPTQPSVGEQLSSTAVVSFARPNDNGSPIDSYEVRGLPGGTATCTASPCNVERLTNGLEYAFQVRAHNEVGWSEWSPSSTPYTPDELPGTPPIAQPDWNDRSATVTWGAIPNQGSTIIDVTIRITPSATGSIVFSGGQSGGTATFNGLTNGTAYTFTLVARNSKGNSPPSPTSASVIPAGAPTMPNAPNFIADNGFVVVAWSAANGNGDDNLSYIVKLRDETTSTTTTNPVGATLSTNLPAVNGHVYNAIVNVSNKYTARFSPQGVDSPRSASAKAIGIPTAPGSVAASAGAGNGAIGLSWSAAAASGGTIFGYQVSTNNGPWNNVGNVTATTFSSGLTLGATYTFRVRALNDNLKGIPGDPSAPSNAAIPYTPPEKATVNCSPSVTTIGCSWSANALNGPGPQTVTVSGATASNLASGSWTSGDIGWDQTRGISVQVCNSGGSGNNCSSQPGSAWTGFPPLPVITSFDVITSTLGPGWVKRYGTITWTGGADPITCTFYDDGVAIYSSGCGTSPSLSRAAPGPGAHQYRLDICDVFRRCVSSNIVTHTT